MYLKMTMSQSKKNSALESLAQVIIGYVLALITQLIVFPLYGMDMPFKSNLEIVGIFACVSYARQYLIRRYHERKIKNERGEKG